MGNVLAVCMNKGGVGKTTLATHIAAVASAAAPPAKALLVDLDPQGNAAVVFGLDPDRLPGGSVHDVLLGRRSLTDAAVAVTDRLHIVAASDELNTFELHVLTRPKKFPRPLELLRPAIEAARTEYDWIFIDCPPSLGLLAGNALAAATDVLIPFVPEPFSVKGLQRVVQAIESAALTEKEAPRIAGVVAMMVDARSSLHQELLAEARDYCGHKEIPMFETVIPRSIRFAHAAAYHGKPAVWTDRSHPAAAAYYTLTEEVLAYAVQKKRTARSF